MDKKSKVVSIVGGSTSAFAATAPVVKSVKEVKVTAPAAKSKVTPVKGSTPAKAAVKTVAAHPKHKTVTKAVTPSKSAGKIIVTPKKK